MCVLSFKNGNDDPTRDSFEKYYISLVEIKYFNELIDNKPCFDQAVKKKEKSKTLWKTYWNIRNDDYTAVNLLDFYYHQNYYKPIVINLLRKTNTNIPQQINFTEK